MAFCGAGAVTGEINQLRTIEVRHREEIDGLWITLDQGAAREGEMAERIIGETSGPSSHPPRWSFDYGALTFGLSGLNARADVLAADASVAQGALQVELSAHMSMEAAVASMCHALGAGPGAPEHGSPVGGSRENLLATYERVWTLVVDAFHRGVWQTLAVARARYPRIDLESLSMGYDAAPGH